MPATPISAELLRRFDVPGPCYTSYPTPDRFVEAFGPEDYALALAQWRDGPAANVLPLSLYVHIPFCESLCYCCTCDNVVTKKREQAESYLRYLAREVELHTAILGKGRPVSQLHLGGGTPTFLSDAQLKELLDMLRRGFEFAPGAECSIDVDPRTVNAARLQALAELGFNRLSFGLVDFDCEVQEAVNRVQPAAQVFALMTQARTIGFDSIKVDLIYGLPRQTPESFERTLQQVSQLRPDRIALYAYAHLPQRFKSQRRIVSAELPPAADKAAMHARAFESLQQGGYEYIGPDHFALPNDALAVAKRQGRLHRNFQGYSAQRDCDIIGLGVCAMGRIGATVRQNAKTLADYCDALDQGRLPVARGLALTRDDLARRAVIMALMCHGQVVFESIELAWILDFRKYFAAEMGELARLEDDGLLLLDDAGFQVTDAGKFFLRGIAAVFDRYLQADRNRAKFSRIL